MTEAQAHEAIAAYFLSGWTAIRPTIPVVMTNELGSSADEWVRLSIAPALSRQSAIGAVTRWTRSGTIGIGVFTAAGIGTKRASQLADDVRAILEGQQIISEADIRGDGVVTLAGSTGSGQSDGKWFYTLVTVPYSFDQLKGEVNVARHQQVFRYTVTAVALEYVIALPGARASENYRVDVSIADGVNSTTFQCPIASRTKTQFLLVPDAELTVGDVLEFTVEDLT